MIASAFTCTGPYAVLIMLGIKRVENRNARPEPGKGRCAVGCSKSFCREEFGNFVQWAARALPEEDFARIPSWSDIKDWPGKIVGACDYACRERSQKAEPWDEGYPYWWDLSNIECFDLPIPCRGNVGMWQMPPDLARQVTVADLLARSVGAMISTADDARRIFEAAAPIAGGNEGFFVLPLDAYRRTIAAPALVSIGTKATATVRPKDVFAEALKVDADSVIVAHNHPGGNPNPSPHDRQLTEAITRLGEALGVKVIDHLVLTRGQRV